MRTRFPQLISDVIKENDREHIVPSVEKYARIAMSQREQKQKEQTPVKDDQKDAEIHVKLEIKSEPKGSGRRSTLSVIQLKNKNDIGCGYFSYDLLRLTFVT